MASLTTCGRQRADGSVRANRPQYADGWISIHGGTLATAEAEIRALVEDALHQGKAHPLPNGRWQVSIAGYKATVSADGATVVNFGTVHR